MAQEITTAATLSVCKVADARLFSIRSIYFSVSFLWFGMLKYTPIQQTYNIQNKLRIKINALCMHELLYINNRIPSIERRCFGGFGRWPKFPYVHWIYLFLLQYWNFCEVSIERVINCGASKLERSYHSNPRNFKWFIISILNESIL